MPVASRYCHQCDRRHAGKCVAASIAIDGLKDLTARQRQVARLLCEGRSNGDIARELGLALSTVKTHLTAVFDAVGLGTRAEVMLRVLETEREALQSRVVRLERDLARERAINNRLLGLSGAAEASQPVSRARPT